MSSINFQASQLNQLFPNAEEPQNELDKSFEFRPNIDAYIILDPEEFLSPQLKISNEKKVIFENTVVSEYPDNQNDINEISLDSETKHQEIFNKKSEMQLLQTKREEELKKPVFFNILITGATALGKSTFIDAFINNRFEKIGEIRPATKDITETIAQIRHEKLNFTLKMIDVPGYHSNTNINEFYKTIKKTITKRFKIYRNRSKGREFSNKLQANNDERIHVCLYFISAPRISGKDIFLMKKIQKYTNLIPIIAKGDCYTTAEIREIKQQFLKEAELNKLEIFDCENALINDEKKLKLLQNGIFGPSPPFLIISSVNKMEIEPNVFCYARKYNWGVCNIENPNHCDFLLLYKLLIGYFSMEMIKITDYFYKKHLDKNIRKKKQEEENKIVKFGFGVIAVFIGGLFLRKSVF